MIKRWLRSIEQVLFPAKCLGCGRLFVDDTETIGSLGDQAPSGDLNFACAMARYYCSGCRVRWTKVASPMCTRCGLVFVSRSGEDHLCGRCLEHPGTFSKARAAGIYDQSLRTAIQELKFKRCTTLAKPLGQLLFQTFEQQWGPGEIDLITPVPLHRRRFRERGFNQAYLLIRRWQLPDDVVIVRDLLIRSRETAPQTGLDRRQRRINLKNAFSMKRDGQTKGKRVLLIDDVLTTGATVDACARALIKDGAHRVDVLTLARAV